MASVPWVACVACDQGQVDDRALREQWVHEQTASHGLYLREFLNGNRDIVYFDGWHPPEHDPATKGAWRWMGKRSITRLRARPAGGEARDMELRIYGWVPYEHIGLRTSHMTFSVNGHVLGRFEPPRENFEHALVVPKWLLANDEWVDFVITVANTVRPGGDFRDLGFATTGITWKVAGST